MTIFARGARGPMLARVAIACAMCAAVVAPAALVIAATPARTVDIDIAKFMYGPKDVTVAPGTKVVWTNRDETPHTVASADKTFTSKGLDTEDKFEHTFSVEGDFAYICSVHPFMTGVVHVRKP